MFLFLQCCPQGWAQNGHLANVCGKMKGKVMGKEGEKEKEEETKRRGGWKRKWKGKRHKEREVKRKRAKKKERGERHPARGGGEEFGCPGGKAGLLPGPCLSLWFSVSS